jgi:Pyruvate/2-oxoacid:ferredoxin oxidoreductase delta subunit/flavodoxin
MKIGIVYFSGTGGTANLADIFRLHFEESEHEVDLIRMKHNTEYNLEKYDLFGIGAPVYSYRAPRFVTRILSNLNFQKKPFFVFSCIGGQAGNTHWNLYKSMRDTAGICLGEFSVTITTNIRSWMPNKRRILPKYSISAYDENKAKEFVNEILHNLKYEIEKIPKRKIFLSIFTTIFSHDNTMLVTAGYKLVDKKTCTKCGLCANQICPSGAISINREEYPKIHQLICVGCNGCLNLCPVDAIWTLTSRHKHQYNIFAKYIIGFDKK